MTEEEIMPLAQTAYDAYCHETGGKSAVTGAPLPHFEALPDNMKQAWASAADAVWAESVA